MSTSPKVSILCITYNHSRFIKQAFDGFLMQETNFEFEILINDDASTDGTAEIIREYQKKHPKLIKPVFQKENQYSKGKRNFMLKYLVPKAKGKYLALCEGDDYWTDPHKLQKQVDFLDKRSDYALCFHPVKVVYEDGSQGNSIYPEGSDKSLFTNKELLTTNFIQTNSVMYRKQTYKKEVPDLMPGDWYLHLYHASFGKIGFIDEVMAVYRRHSGGIWWEARNDMEVVWKKHGVAHLTFYAEVLKIYEKNSTYKEVLHDSMKGFFNMLIELNEKTETNLVTEMFEKLPNEITALVIENHNDLVQTKSALEQKEIQYNQDLQYQKNETIQLAQELDQIKNSRAYKYLERFRSIKHRIARH